MRKASKSRSMTVCLVLYSSSIDLDGGGSMGVRNVHFFNKTTKICKVYILFLNAVPQGPRWAFNYSVCVHSGLSVLTKIFFSSMICEHCDHSRPQGLGPEIHGSLQFRIDPILKTIVNQWFGGGLRNPYVETCIPTAICFIHQK